LAAEKAAALFRRRLFRRRLFRAAEKAAAEKAAAEKAAAEKAAAEKAAAEKAVAEKAAAEKLAAEKARSAIDASVDNSSFGSRGASYESPVRRRPVDGCTPRSARNGDCAERSVFGVTLRHIDGLRLLDYTCPDTFTEWRVWIHPSGARVTLVAEDLDCVVGELTTSRFEQMSVDMLPRGSVVVVNGGPSCDLGINTIFSRFQELHLTVPHSGDASNTVSEKIVLTLSHVINTTGFRLQVDCSPDHVDAARTLLVELGEGASWIMDDVHMAPKSLIKHFILDASQLKTFCVSASCNFVASRVELPDGICNGLLFERKHHSDDSFFVLDTPEIGLDDLEQAYNIPAADEMKLRRLVDTTLWTCARKQKKAVVLHPKEVDNGRYLPVVSSPLLSFPVPMVAEHRSHVTEHKFGEGLVTTQITCLLTAATQEFTISIVILETPESVAKDAARSIARDSLHSSVRNVRDRLIVSAWGPCKANPLALRLVDAVLLPNSDDEWLHIEWVIPASSSSAACGGESSSALADVNDWFPPGLLGYREVLLMNAKALL
ncbi:Hypothetical protein, putative, partial [Bodo saltans]